LAVIGQFDLRFKVLVTEIFGVVCARCENLTEVDFALSGANPILAVDVSAGLV
jgi:hypothetical protein